MFGLIGLLCLLVLSVLFLGFGLFGSFTTVLAIITLVLASLAIAALAGTVIRLQEENRQLIKTSGADTHAALHDPLTGAANRRHFEQHLEQLVAEKSPKHVLMMLDLDRFKPVNDLHGHAAGDALLKEISAGLKKIVSSRDLVARLGGDEFAIILNKTNRQVAEAVTLRVLEFVTKFRLNWEGQRISVGTSIGLVNIDKSGLNPSDLLAVADEALYAAKEAGRGAAFLAVPGPAASDSPTFTRIGSDLPEAEETAPSHEPEDGRRQELFGAVVDYYSKDGTEMPDSRRGSRRRHQIQHWIMTEPRTIGDELSPGMRIREIIDDASAKSDGGADLSRWILAHALNSAVQVTSSEIDRIGFILPIPAQAVVSDPSLGTDLMRMNALAHLPLRHITFLLYNVSSVYTSPNIEAFRERVAASDFALGYEVRASTLDVLAPLRYAKYDELHLGRELSRNLRPGTPGYAAVESLLATAEQHGTTVVASGVDTAEEIVHLSAMGVNRFSGPFIGEPRPVHEVLLELKDGGDTGQPVPQLKTGT